MASPQTENGFTPISNELLDVILKRNFISTHLKIILCCCRYTYGFSRKEAMLSESYISKATGIGKRYISKELKSLIEMNIIKVIQESTFTSSRIISLNKNYDEWGSRTTVPQSICNSTDDKKHDTTVELQNNTTVELQFYQENKIIKQDINKYMSKKDIEVFFESVWKLYPRKEGKGSIKDSQKKVLYNLGFDAVSKCIERYKQAKINTDPKYLQMGSTFFNSGYVDYLDKNYNQNTPLEEMSGAIKTKGGIQF